MTRIALLTAIMLTASGAFASKVSEIASETPGLLAAAHVKRMSRALTNIHGDLHMTASEMCFTPAYRGERECTRYSEVLNVSVLSTVPIVRETRIVVTTADGATQYSVPESLLGRILSLIREGSRS